MKLVYPAIFTPCEEGGYVVEVPDLPGCVTEGDSLAEAISMGEDAASGWVLEELERGQKAPTPRKMDSLHPEAGSFVSLLRLDMDAYTEK